MVSFWFEADAVLGLNRDDLGTQQIRNALHSCDRGMERGGRPSWFPLQAHAARNE